MKKFLFLILAFALIAGCSSAVQNTNQVERLDVGQTTPQKEATVESKAGDTSSKSAGIRSWYTNGRAALLGKRNAGRYILMGW